MILKFPNLEARAVFLHRMEGDASVKMMRFKPSFSQPTVVIVRGRGGLKDDRIKSELQRYLDADVKIFDDVQFSVMN